MFLKEFLLVINCSPLLDFSTSSGYDRGPMEEDQIRNRITALIGTARAVTTEETYGRVPQVSLGLPGAPGLAGFARPGAP